MESVTLADSGSSLPTSQHVGFRSGNCFTLDITVNTGQRNC